MGAMKEQYTKIHSLSVSNKLLNFVNEELLKDTNISSEKFWEGFDLPGLRHCVVDAEPTRMEA